MQTFDQHRIQLVRSQQVTEDTARHYANHWNRLGMELHGFVSRIAGKMTLLHSGRTPSLAGRFGVTWE